MADSTTPKPKITRGTSFPVLSLPAATKIVREAGAYGKQHTASALAAYAGHTTSNSGAWRGKLAALRDWGLVTSGTSDSLLLTDRALQIAHPDSPEATQKALLEAFNNCKLYLNIYNDLAKGIELKSAVIANKAVTGHGITITSKDAFAHSFVESAVAVGLAEQISADTIRLVAEGYTPANPAETNNDTTKVESPANEPPKFIQQKSTVTPVFQQSWPITSGEIILSINSTKALDGKVFLNLGQVVEAIEKLVVLLGNTEEKVVEASNDLPE